MLNNIHKYFTDTVQIIMTEKESKQTIDANVRAIQVQKKDYSWTKQIKEHLLHVKTYGTKFIMSFSAAFFCFKDNKM